MKLKRTELVLIFGLALFVLWVLVTLTYPYIGFVISIAGVLGIIVFMLYVTASYLASRG